MSMIGSPHNFWLATEDYIDLTHPSPSTELNVSTSTNSDNHKVNNYASHSSDEIEADNSDNRTSKQGTAITLHTSTDTIRIDPHKSALAIIDMQNFFLSPALGRPSASPAQQAVANLVSILPSVRTAGIQVCYINWGLTTTDLQTLPPAVRRAFGEKLVPGSGKDPKVYAGVGREMGEVEVEGRKVDAGRMLMVDQWNAKLYEPLEQSRLSSLTSHSNEDASEAHTQDATYVKALKEDVILTKNRMSGLWGYETEATRFFDEQGIKTIMFAGVNTDQCVLSSLIDGFNKGYDCILLSDGCATTSPSFGRECVEFNVARAMGFVTTCHNLEQGIRRMNP